MGVVAGLSAKEALVMAPGEVCDLLALHLEAHGLKKKPEGG